MQSLALDCRVYRGIAVFLGIHAPQNGRYRFSMFTERSHGRIPLPRRRSGCYKFRMRHLPTCRCQSCRIERERSAPSAEEIAAACRKIRSGWTPQTRLSRIADDFTARCAAREPSPVPVVPLIDLDNYQQGVDALWGE